MSKAIKNTNSAAGPAAAEKSGRVPITVRMKKDIIELGRSLARTYIGSEDKLGNLLEESVMFYSAHKDDDTKATALLKTTQEILTNRINDQMESILKEITKRESQMVERVAGLQAISAYETCLIEMLLHNYLPVGKDEEKYKEFRKKAQIKMKDRYAAIGTEKLAELHDQNINLENEIQALKEQLKEKSSETQRIEEQLEKTRHEESRARATIQEYNEKLKQQEQLIVWYERRDREVPQIQEKNKGFIGKQDYEKSAAEFEKRYPKPKRI